MTQLEQVAKKMHTHVVVFKRHSEEELVAVKAQAGKSTKCIARELGLTESQVQYRIGKAQRTIGEEVSFRKEFRNGNKLADIAERAVSRIASRRIQREVAPKFVPLASSRMNQ